MALSFSLDLVSFVLGALGAALLMLAVFLPKLSRLKSTQEHMKLTFDEIARASLTQSQEQFLQMAAEKLKEARKDGDFDLERRQKAIAELVDPIGKSLKDMEGRIETLGKAGAGLEAQLKNFAQDQTYLREQTQHLVNVLRNPAARGRWGEMQLQRTFEMIGFIEGVHYKAQSTVSSESGTQKPDFIVSMPNGVQIVIDVKTPLDPYWNIIDMDGSSGQEQALIHFRQKVRDHLKILSQKDYWRQFESPEFVVMFLPSESLYSLAVSHDSGLLEDASRHNVILASPTTIMGLLRVVMYGWQQQKIAEEAKTIATLGSDLYRRVSIFGEHMGKLGRNLGTAVEAYNKAIGSLDQMILPSLRKFKDLQVSTGGKDLVEPEVLENSPRALSSPELQVADFTAALERKAKVE